MGILVVAPGMHTLIQDAGRPGYARFGVARSGAFDLASWRRANRSAGNDLPRARSDDAGPASLEVLIGGLEFVTIAPVTLAVSGAEVSVAATDSTGKGRELARDTAHRLEPGTTVKLSRAKTGLRAYVAFFGGLGAPAVLGSRSYDTTAQLGPLPLVGGLEIAVGAHTPGDGYDTGEPTRVDSRPGAEQPAARTFQL
ncbi:MAG: hypothetical protein HQ526_04355, partial [Actinobacteria bacterium]|nr:hypothetical protein [Actinomycetota bacterium]